MMILITGTQLSLPILNHFPLMRGSGEGAMTKVTILVVSYQLDDLSPSYWDLCIDHFQHPENTKISYMARYVEEYGKKNMQLCTTILVTTITMIIMNLNNN